MCGLKSLPLVAIVGQGVRAVPPYKGLTNVSHDARGRTTGIRAGDRYSARSVDKKKLWEKRMHSQEQRRGVGWNAREK